MESSPTTLPQTTFFPAGKSPSSGCRTPSSSSFSSCSSYFLDESSSPSPPSPATIISSVPFSWEKLPGVPKKQPSKRFDEDDDAYSLIPLLPLPPSKPASIGNNCKKMIKNQREDPFFAALVECSKQDQDQDQDRDRERGTNNNNVWSNKVSRTLSDRFGFVNLYTSCKNTCAVSESIIYLPRSSRTASNYGLVNRRSHQNYYHP